MAQEREIVHGYQINSKRLIGYQREGNTWHAVYYADTPRGARYFSVTRRGRKKMPTWLEPAIDTRARPRGFPKNVW